MGNISDEPVVSVVMCRNRPEGHQAQTLQGKYLDAVLNADGLPVALPHVLTEPELLSALLPKLDGIFLPGSPGNVQLHLYGESGDESDANPEHNLLNMALITVGLERHIPIFVICQGLRELVITTGGIPYHRLCDHPQFLEHREDAELPVEQQYAPSHEAQVQQGGLLSRLTPGCSTFWVNPLRDRDVRTLGPQLRVGARSQDGSMEAAGVHDHLFVLGAQWYPEWNSSGYALSRLLLEGLITVCQNHLAKKQRL